MEMEGTPKRVDRKLGTPAREAMLALSLRPKDARAVASLCPSISMLSLRWFHLGRLHILGGIQRENMWNPRCFIQDVASEVESKEKAHIFGCGSGKAPSVLELRRKLLLFSDAKGTPLVALTCWDGVGLIGKALILCWGRGPSTRWHVCESQLAHISSISLGCTMHLDRSSD